MTEQPSSIGPDIPVRPQPLGFKLISDDGNTARFQALVESQEAPGSPVLAVTLTIASPVLRQAPKQLQALLGGIKAGFALLSELPSDNGGPSEDEPFNINQQLQIGLSLASFEGPGPVGVAVTVQTTAGIVPVPAGSDPIGDAPVENFLQHNLGANLDDYWQVSPGQSFTATVRPSMGQGTIRNTSKTIPVHPHGPYCINGPEIIVHAGPNVAMDYSMSANFILTRHDVKGA